MLGQNTSHSCCACSSDSRQCFTTKPEIISCSLAQALLVLRFNNRVEIGSIHDNGGITPQASSRQGLLDHKELPHKSAKDDQAQTAL
eukprot:1609314-Amphidinium_carterae.1